MQAEPDTSPTPSWNGSSLAGSVCSVNTLRPACGPTMHLNAAVVIGGVLILAGSGLIIYNNR
jgi:hypothetical protein